MVLSNTESFLSDICVFRPQVLHVKVLLDPSRKIGSLQAIRRYLIRLERGNCQSLNVYISYKNVPNVDICVDAAWLNQQKLWFEAIDEVWNEMVRKSPVDHRSTLKRVHFR